MLNSIFTLIRNKKSHQISPINFYTSQTEAKQTLDKLRPVLSGNQTKPTKVENVFIIIMESFALEYMKYPHNGTSYAPFFESFAEKGTYYENHFC